MSDEDAVQIVVGRTTLGGRAVPVPHASFLGAKRARRSGSDQRGRASSTTARSESDIWAERYERTIRHLDIPARREGVSHETPA
jgi:hypothetical protein